MHSGTFNTTNFKKDIGVSNYVKGTEGVIGLTVENCGNGVRNQTQSCKCEPPPPPVAPPVGPSAELKPPNNGKILGLL